MNFKKFILLFIIIISYSFVYSEVYIIKSFEYEKFEEIIRGIENGLQKSNIKCFNLEKEGAYIKDDPENVCFTLGEKAYLYIKEHTSKIRIIALMVIEKSLLKNNSRTVFIKSDMDIYRKALLLKKIITNMKGIIIPCSKVWFKKNHDAYREKLSLKGVDLRFEVIDKDVGISFEKMVVPKNYIVMAVYDVNLYNQSSIFNIFRVVYEKHIPFVGFSTGFIKNGSFLAILPDYYAMGVYSGKILLKARKNKVSYLLDNPLFNIYINGNLMDDFNFNLNLTYEDIKVIK